MRHSGVSLGVFILCPNYIAANGQTSTKRTVTYRKQQAANTRMSFSPLFIGQASSVHCFHRCSLGRPPVFTAFTVVHWAGLQCSLLSPLFIGQVCTVHCFHCCSLGRSALFTAFTVAHWAGLHCSLLLTTARARFRPSPPPPPRHLILAVRHG